MGNGNVGAQDGRMPVGSFCGPYKPEQAQTTKQKTSGKITISLILSMEGRRKGGKGGLGLVPELYLALLSFPIRLHYSVHHPYVSRRYTNIPVK